MQKYEVIKNSLLPGHHLDFFLEDDMFELEGFVKSIGSVIEVEIEYAIPHILAETGNIIEFEISTSGISARSPKNGKTYQTEINRVYERIDDLNVEQMEVSAALGLDIFFQKNTDTLIWFEEGLWHIELNRINLFFSGERKEYTTAGDLIADNKELIKEAWQLIYYSSETDVSEVEEFDKLVAL